ncbi:MAG: DUF4159 domain-containing protein [Alphaproteobacteria bacterium]|nr:DUF4159 domain-containing protein [Alphaproteobacteria bacterium]
MAGLGALTFAVPWALAALAVLPVIWWLLRVNPPAPRQIRFPPVRLLFDLRQTEETPIKTPLWLMILRLLVAALVIVAIAGPLLNPAPRLHGDGPLLLVIDDGWTAAARWPARIETLESLIDQAERERRAIVVATTAPQAAGVQADGGRSPVSGLMTAAEARGFVRALVPRPWPADRAALLEAVESAAFQASLGGGADVAWLSDGLDGGDPEIARDLAGRLQRLGTLRLYVDDPRHLAKLLVPPETGSPDMRLEMLRAVAGPATPVWVRASTVDGRLLARQRLDFADGALRAAGELDLPRDLRNDIARIEIEGEASAGAVVLIDARWRRRPVGLVSGGSFETSQPLLSDLYYLERALSPYNEVERGTVRALLEGEFAALILADVGRVLDDDRQALERWIAEGGVLVRFAGPRLAAGVDSLVPVRLRAGGGRTLGGALSWDQPMALARFAEDSPFAGLSLGGDVRIQRQVLAEPALDLDRRTWARLADGTPLVTAEPRGAGWLVLFHTTANAEWSNLALSGTFVEMLGRIVALSEGVAGEAEAMLLPALESLDGFGHLVEAPPDAVPLTAAAIGTAVVAPEHPPGLYGSALFRRALNVSAGVESLRALDGLPNGIARAAYGKAREIDLGPWLLAAAFMLAVADTVIGLALRGLLPWPEPRDRRTIGAWLAVVLAGAAWALSSSPAAAETVAENEAARIALESAGTTRLAYVLTGDDRVDSVSHQGLFGLSLVLRQRTSIEPLPPIGVDPGLDELVFFPLLYWPITGEQRPISGTALAKIDEYLRIGGMIVFDTRDQSPTDRLRAANMPGGGKLRHLLGGLNVPPLVVVPDGHALTQAFYLLDRFPGRWDSGKVWVERYEGDVNDGVSSLVIGGNDWASAWALEANGMPLYPLVPGGERQREMAFRFGINLTMYALTGNYKADQVHIPAILRRLGRDDAEPVD